MIDGKKEAVVYCRVSTKKQMVKENSLDGQELECKELADKYGFVIRSFFAEDKTGTSTARAEYQKMISYIKRNKNITVLIVWKRDRLSRNREDYVLLNKVLRERGIKTYAFHGNNGDSASDIAEQFQEVNRANEESDTIGERAILGIKMSIRKGRWPHRVPLGYKRDKPQNGYGNLIPDKKTSPLIIYAFNLMASGKYSQRAVRKMLKNRNLQVKNTTLSKMLHNSFYCGLIRSKHVKSPVKGIHEPLISKALFDKAQHVMTKGYPKVSKAAKTAELSLTSFVYCSHCKRPLTGAHKRKPSGKEYDYYWCPNPGCLFFRKEILNDAFKALLIRIKPAKGIALLYEKKVNEFWEKENSFEKDEAKRLENNLKKFKEQKKNLRNDLSERIIDKDEYNESKTDIDEKILEDEASLKKIQANLDQSLESFRQFAWHSINDPSSFWNEASREMKRELQILIFPGKIFFDGNSFEIPKISSLFTLVAEKPESDQKENCDSEGISA